MKLKWLEFFKLPLVVSYAKEMITGIAVNNDECYLSNIDEEFSNLVVCVSVE